MHRDEFRKIVSDSVTQTLAQRGESASALPADQLQSIVNGIADGVFAGLEATLDDDGVVNSIDLSHPGVAEAAGKAAAAAAAAATQAVISGHVTPLTPPEAAAMQAAATQPQAWPRPATTTSGASPRLTPSSSPNVAPPVPPQSQAAIATSLPGGSAGEVLLWRGRPYMTIGTVYELTTQRLRVLRGIASQTIEEVELVRVRDTAVTQSMFERLFHIGDIEIDSTDARDPIKTLFNVRDPIEVRELIRKAVVDERARRRVFYREDMASSGGEFDMHDEVHH